MPKLTITVDDEEDFTSIFTSIANLDSVAEVVKGTKDTDFSEKLENLSRRMARDLVHMIETIE